MYICSPGGPIYVDLQPRRAHMYICTPEAQPCTFAASRGIFHTSVEYLTPSVEYLIPLWNI